jgi:hypothetical protein
MYFYKLNVLLGNCYGRVHFISLTECFFNGSGAAWIRLKVSEPTGSCSTTLSITINFRVLYPCDNFMKRRQLVPIDEYRYRTEPVPSRNQYMHFLFLPLSQDKNYVLQII